MLQVIKDDFRLLTFRITREEILNFGWKHLVFGLICTWIVGAGRNWDNPQAGFLQHLGIGSVVYVFILSALLAVIIAPLMPQDWTLFRVITFISLVSPPAVLYAIPVEKFATVEAANSLNACFLLVVSIWRVLLLMFFLQRFALLSPSSVLVATSLPLILIVMLVFILNFERLVLDSMGGFRDKTSNDASDGLLGLVFLISILLFPVVLIAYFWIIRRNAREDSLNLDE